jgi:adenosylmethionine-8-amino-7-oxononanoate aminotransferase
VASAFWGEEGIEFAHGHTFGGNPLSDLFAESLEEELRLARAEC